MNLPIADELTFLIIHIRIKKELVVNSV